MSDKKQAAQPGSTLITWGVILAVLGVVVLVLAVSSGGPGNPALTFALVAVGILLAILGYAKRGARR